MVDLETVARMCEESQFPYVECDHMVVIYLPPVRGILRSLDIYSDGKCGWYSLELGKNFESTIIEERFKSTDEFIERLQEVI